MTERRTGETAARKERERRYHDHRFTVGTRRRVRKYYAVDAGTQHYRSEVLERGREGVRALEYGCGTGSLAFGLAQRGAAVTGIDISPVAIRKAKRKAKRRGLDVRFRSMDAEALTFPDDSFDLVCGSGILHHLDLDAALAEIARVLAPGGRAIFLEPLGHNPVINLYRRLTPTMRSPDERPLLQRDLSLARQRFGTVDLEYFDLVALGGVVVRNLPGGRSAIAALHSIDRWLFSHVRSTRRWAWVVVIGLSP